MKYFTHRDMRKCNLFASKRRNNANILTTYTKYLITIIAQLIKGYVKNYPFSSVN